MWHSRQNGFTLTQLVIVLLILGFGALAGFKISKPYAEAKIIQEVVVKTLTAAKNEPTVTPKEIARRIFDQANVQSIVVDYDSIEVKLVNSSEYSVHVDLITKMPLWKKASLLIELTVDATTPP